MDKTTLIELNKPIGTEPYSREILNGNVDLIDKNLIAFLFAGVPFSDYTKAAITFDEDGMPQSQAFTGSNGLAGSITWTFTATTCTAVLAITSPTTESYTITTDLDTFAEAGVVS